MSVRSTEIFGRSPTLRSDEPARILVVDDRPTSRAIVRGVLDPTCYEVFEAESGTEALALIAERAFDLVILDILMPDMNGYDVLKQIRKTFSEAELPVIMASVKQQSGDMVKALKQGANDYVTKPIDFPVLFARIQSQVTIKRSEDGVRRSRESLKTVVAARNAELLRISDVLKKEVSERLEVERTQKQQEQQFRDFAEVAADWFWEMDAELRFTYLSDRFEAVTFLQPKAVLGQRCDEVFSANRAGESILENQFHALEMRRSFDKIELLVERLDGASMVLRLSGKPIFDERGVFQGYRGAGRDVTEARNLSAELSYQASHDRLTGLVNRDEFESRLRRALDTTRLRKLLTGSGKRATEHVLCFFDLDQFKLINDTCGHVAGDELLRQIGQLLTGQLRRRDTIARLGGDEFGVLMEHCSLEQAERVTENIRTALEDFRFSWEDKNLVVTVSTGIAPINSTTKDMTAVMRAADSACYAAKEVGNNRIQVFREDDVMLTKRQGEVQWVGRINRALEENRFELFFQPIVSFAGATNGLHYEFLLRMREEDGRIIAPGDFLGAAERYNLVTKIDRWVISESFRWLCDHPHHLRDLYQCSINLSGHSLGDEKFQEFVAEEFRRTAIPPSKVCFEITETAAIQNLVSATRFIKALKSIGCIFSLDDFGSGLSSFAYLKNLPVDILKIDGMFVRDIVTDPIELAMVKSINEIGHVMGKQTVAEFVEDQAIFEKLKETGVDYAQGYLLGEPKPMEDT